jgi:UDP-GlcNAc:undecaprenyl-phosphate GlcNAc-1-phosphate transferase
VSGLLDVPVSDASSLYAILIAAAVALAATPIAIRIARRLGIVDEPGGRRIHDRPVPRLGGVAIILGIAVALALILPLGHSQSGAILIGAVLISLLGAVDDARGLPPLVKFLGQIGCAAIPASQGVTIDHLTLPLVAPLSTHALQYPLAILFIVAVANIVNFADGIDGLAAGICAVSAGTLCVLALSLDRFVAAALAASVCGACIGFLRFNFHPARIFMGDSGSLPLGFLLAATSITGVMKTAATLALVFPLIVLLVPIADTSFVILKRLKYGQRISGADQNHFHHRMLRIGYSQGKAAVMLYVWCGILAAFALAVRFIHYRGPTGVWHLWPTIWLSLFAVVALVASLYVIYVLEILKYRHLRVIGLARNRDVAGDTPLVEVRRRRRAGVA